MFYLLSFGKLVVNQLIVSQWDDCIVLLFNSNISAHWINVNSLQDKHNINAVSENIKFKWVFGTKIGKGSVNLLVAPVFKPHTYKLYILRHCTTIVYISDLIHFVVQWNLSIGTNFCVWNRQVFGLYKLKISCIRTLFKVWFIQDFGLFRVRFRQVYTGFWSWFVQGSV